MLIACIVTGEKAFNEFQLLLHTLEQWESTAVVHVLTDTPTNALLTTIKTRRVTVNTRVALDTYTGLTRKDMEARGGVKYATLFHDFTMQKADAIQWVFNTKGEEASTHGVWFLDADICLLAPLPVLASPTRIALSPHYIRTADESRYGHFNAGMAWIRDPALLDIWRRAAYGSRFYEQAALETVWEAVVAEERIELAEQDNFGWWRYGQSADPPPVIQRRLGFNRYVTGCGLTYDGKILRSLHTHWDEVSEFNVWMHGRLELLARGHAPAKTLLRHIDWYKTTNAKQ